MESAPVENNDRINLDERSEETFSSSPGERREKKRIFFETKSLAEVYAIQGHISTALEIYRRMLKKNSTDQQIEKRIAELESFQSMKRGMKSKEPDA